MSIDILQWLIFFAVLMALVFPVGSYMAKVFTHGRTWLDPVFNPLDNAIYKLIGIDPTKQQRWTTYVKTMLITNGVMFLVMFLLLELQAVLPLNPDHQGFVNPFLAFNTAVSFITNTNWQAYGGESTLSNFSQMGAITFPMFTSATTGFVVAMAWIRAFTVRNGGTDLGNFYRDFVRFITRVLMPICVVIAVVMISQGAVQTLDASFVAHTLQGADQTIVVGPVASQGTIGLVGTNGGGFYNVNAAHPFQNPTPVTNIILIVMMALLPASIV